MAFLIYDAKVAVALLVFYLFYRFLLKKETFHRFNRFVLVGTAVLSFLLPLCIITIHKPMEMAAPLVTEPAMVAELPGQGLAPLVQASEPWWPVALTILFWAGVAFVLARVLISILSILRIIRQGEPVREEAGCRILVTERNIDPFSWMKYIVLSRKDWEIPHESILAHEKAHIAYGHSIEILLVDVLSALQWFNPAIWMLRADLKELHEYEADDAVLRTGADLREYQYLLIRKAVSKSGYSVANSFNHSILKNRITMMSKPKSVTLRGLRALYVIPLVAAGLACNSQTVTDYKVSENSPETKAVGQNYPVPTEIRLQIVQEGEDVNFYVDDEKVSLDAIGEKVIEARGDADFAYVSILGDPNVNLGIVQDVKEELRGVGQLRIMYSCKKPEVKVERKLEPTGATKSILEFMEGSSEGDVQVRLNSQDKLLYLRTGGEKDINVIYQEDLYDLAKKDIEKNNGISFFFIADRGSSYGAYSAAVQSVYDAFRSVREDLAMQKYGKAFDNLEEEQQEELREQCSVRIYETGK